MNDSHLPNNFIERLNTGTESVAGEVYSLYIERLCRVATSLIGERLKRHYGAEDAAHSALGSFFRGMNEKKYRIDQSHRLWALLVTIMRHKIQERGGKAKYDILSVDVVDREPSHEEAVELADAIETALTGLKPSHREICCLFYQEGLSFQEIATRVKCSRWTIRRVLDDFGECLVKYLSNESKN
jgi:RNA polymerase sigma factor (sigma-70 family)